MLATVLLKKVQINASMGNHLFLLITLGVFFPTIHRIVFWNSILPKIKYIPLLWMGNHLKSSLKVKFIVFVVKIQIQSLVNKAL